MCEGIHAEGPCVATLGGLPPSEARMPLPRFRALLDAMAPGLRIMTISPSTDAPGGYQRIQELLRRGVVPALGHDKTTTLDEVLGALRAAAAMGDGVPRPHVTHLYNVKSFHHRAAGLTNVGLLSSFPHLPEYDGIVEPSIEIIGDGLHVTPPSVALALAAKSHDKLCFITDGIAAPVVGTTMNYAGRSMEVVRASSMPDFPSHADGACVVLKGTHTLAGSATTMHRVFVSLVQVYGLSPAAASRLCSESPAAVAQLGHVGRLDVGKRADIVCLDPTDLAVERVFVAGVE